jgi:hypothetical protein
VKKVLILLMLILFSVSGCGSGAKDAAMEESSGNSAVAPEARDSMKLEDTVGMDMDGGAPEVSFEDRKIILNAEVRLRVEDIESVCEKVKGKTLELKGYLNDYSIRTGENNTHADISLKVPSTHYQELLDFIVEQGKPDYKREYTNDVTTQYIDLEARVKVLKAEEESLLNLLNKAETIEDILKIKAQITSTRQERESLEGQFKALSHSVEYATINISLYKPRNSDTNLNVENLNIFTRSWSGLIYGLNTLTAKVGNIIVLFFTALPTLILIALVIVAFIYIKRRRKRKGNDDV